MSTSLGTNLEYSALAASEAKPADSCFHCGQPMPAGTRLHAVIDGVAQPMCCHGCEAVAEAIVAAGYANFYRTRTEPARTGQELVPEFVRETEAYDLPRVQAQFVQECEASSREASLILEGVTCAACLWLIERHLGTLPGVEKVSLNYATQRAWLRWDTRRIRLSEILQAIGRIGYRALPYNPDRQQAMQQRDRRAQQRRLAIAGLFGMQVMMLSISLYVGAWSGIEAHFEQLFRWLSLTLTLPVMFYAALPFFNSAGRDLRQRRVSMDVPVSLAIGIAFGASLLATLRGQGEIYFDSVVMFVFFLSASRYFESMARYRCAATVEKLVQSLPLLATRVTAAGEVGETVSAASLAVGDEVLLRPGDTVPADGEIVAGNSAFDESLLSGESLPRERGCGEIVFGGSINLQHPLRLRVTAVGADTVLAEIQRMIDRAQADRPPLARLADRVAARFIAGVLVIVTGVALFWWLQHSDRWFEIALAVLIVSCPCALSLATPTAISATLGRLQGLGLLVKRGAALERLNRVGHVVFDKTGTLTRGKPALQQVICAPHMTRTECLHLAASLERQSEHPLARALLAEAGDTNGLATEVVNMPGGGLRGRVDGQEYILGSPGFVADQIGVKLPVAWLEQIGDEAVSAVVLARTTQALALFTFADALRDDAAELIARLRGRGLSILLMSGDREAAVGAIAERIGIEDYRASLSPAQKMDAVQALQAEGANLLMVGDGINDAPVLASADVSIAMSGATALARSNADIVLLSDQLMRIDEAFAQAARTQRVVRQNLAWALAYNLGAIPAAALGLVAPWLAALGMSLSSLVVVLNALRLTR